MKSRGTRRAKRPRGVTILAVGALYLTLFFAVRLVDSLRGWDYYLEIGASVHPLYLFVTGAVFGALTIPLLPGLWFGWPWARKFAQIYLAVLVLYYWLDRLFLVVSEAAKTNTPFAIAATILIIVWAAWVLNRPAAKTFFQNQSVTGEIHDQ